MARLSNASGRGVPTAWNVVKPDEIDVLASPMFRYFEKITYALKPAGAGEIWCDLIKGDQGNRIYFDFALFHSVPVTHPNARPMPYTNAAGDGTRTDRVAQILYEQHATSLERDT